MDDDKKEGAAKEYADKIESEIKFHFAVGFFGTEENKAAVARFKEFAYRETNGGYLLAIRKLLDYYEDDAKYNFLAGEVLELKTAVDELKHKEKKLVVKTFGGVENE